MIRPVRDGWKLCGTILEPTYVALFMILTGSMTGLAKICVKTDVPIYS